MLVLRKPIQKFVANATNTGPTPLRLLRATSLSVRTLRTIELHDNDRFLTQLLALPAKSKTRFRGRMASQAIRGAVKYKPAFMFDGDASKPHAPASALKRQSCDSDV
jgi:hypothetical protein